MCAQRLLEEGLLKVKTQRNEQGRPKLLPKSRKKSGFRWVRLFASDSNEFQFQFCEQPKEPLARNKPKTIQIGAINAVFRNPLKDYGAILEAADGRQIQISGSCNSDIERWLDRIRTILWPVNEGSELFDFRWLVSVLDTKSSRKFDLCGRYWLELNPEGIAFVDVSSLEEKFLAPLVDLRKVEILHSKAVVDQGRVMDISFVRKSPNVDSRVTLLSLRLFSRQADSLCHSIQSLYANTQFGRKMSIKNGPRTKTFKRASQQMVETPKPQSPTSLRNWLHKSLPSLNSSFELTLENKNRQSDLPSKMELERMESERLLYGTLHMQRQNLEAASSSEPVRIVEGYNLPSSVTQRVATQDVAQYHVPLPTKAVKSEKKDKPPIPKKPKSLKNKNNKPPLLPRRHSAFSTEEPTNQWRHVTSATNEQQSYNTLPPIQTPPPPKQTYNTLANCHRSLHRNQSANLTVGSDSVAV